MPLLVLHSSLTYTPSASFISPYLLVGLLLVHKYPGFLKEGSKIRAQVLEAILLPHPQLQSWTCLWLPFALPLTLTQSSNPADSPATLWCLFLPPVPTASSPSPGSCLLTAGCLWRLLLCSRTATCESLQVLLWHCIPHPKASITPHYLQVQIS